MLENRSAPMRQELISRGYCYGTADAVGLDTDMSASLAELLEECQTLPLDQSCQNQSRYRRHSRMVLLPWNGYLSYRPGSGYHQSTDKNPDNGGVVREFEPLTPLMKSNECLRKLVQFDFEQIPFTDDELGLPRTARSSTGRNGRRCRVLQAPCRY